MLGLINAIVSSVGTVAGYVKEGLVMANRFLTPPKLSHPAQGSAEFDGSSDYIELPNDIITDTDNYTLGAWYYFDTQVSNDSILSFGNSTTDTPLINFETINSGASVQIAQRDNANVTTTLSYTANTSGSWNYLVGTKSGAALKLYLNGSEVASTASATIGALTFDQISIGSLNRTNNINFWDGNLANVAIWNRALSSDEINSVMWKGYQSLTDNEKSGLQAWYSLDNIDGTNVPDSSGNGNDGTAN